MLRGPCTVRSMLNKFECVWGEGPVECGPCWTNLNMSWGRALYSEVHVEQIWMCLGEGPLQWGPCWTNLNMSGGRALYSEVHVEQIWTCLGGPCTMRSNLNKFEHVRGPCTVRSMLNTFEHVRGDPCTVRSNLNKFEHVLTGVGALYSEVHVEQIWTCLGGPCTMRSNLNKFEHVRGPCTVRSMLNTFEHVRGDPCTVRSNLNKFEHVLTRVRLDPCTEGVLNRFYDNSWDLPSEVGFFT